MQKEFYIDGEQIMVDIKRSRRAKRLRITVRRDGAVTAVHPWYVGSSRAIALVENKLKWIKEKVDHFKKLPQNPVAFTGGKREYVKNKEKALILVKNKLEYFNQFYKFKYNNVSIRNQKTRWGSCSRKGNLNFNYKIVFLAEELQDYLIVHELCHLKEMNHSKGFWDLVSLKIPNVKETRKMLRKLF